jgi:uncharacterized protein (TIGR02246 family)
MSLAKTLWFLSVAFIVLPGVRAAGTTNEPPQSVEARKAVASIEDCFNRHDAKALAACWLPNGEFLGPRGERVDGREKIGAAFNDFMERRPEAKLRLEIISIRPVTDDVVMVDATAKTTPPTPNLSGEPYCSIVLAKRDGRWLVHRIQETLHESIAHGDRIKPLEWMVGDWTTEAAAGPDAVVSRSACDWTANGSFLIRKFKVENKQGVISAGTEVIGWDPRAHRIRSWTFDADGGFGESAWTHDGEVWTIRHAGTTADGEDVSVTHVVTTVDADTVKVQSKDRFVQGTKLPDSPEITLKRQATIGSSASKPGEVAKPPHSLLPK